MTSVGVMSFNLKRYLLLGAGSLGIMMEELKPGSITVARFFAFLSMLVMMPGLQASTSDRFEGVATCAGSTCHGRAEGNGEVVRQDEIATWQEPSSPSGAHSRAYVVLAGRRGQDIADRLGLGDARTAPSCLGCHSTYAPANLRGDRFLLSDGVGCESCHGASQEWLPLHYGAAATHNSNLQAGLVPLEDPATRANVCLDCHFGSEAQGQFVTHSMMAAGHPRISFELDLFSALQQHHNFDLDYYDRKRVANSVQMWAIGQAEAVRRSTSLFRKPEFATEGIFPQLYFYDCHSCHRRIIDGPDQGWTFEKNPGRSIPFGNPPFNDENIIALSAIASAIVPEKAETFLSASRAFHHAMAENYPAAQDAAATLNQNAKELSEALASRQYDRNDAFRIIATRAGRVISPSFTDYAGSVQAVMAIDTLMQSLVTSGRITVGAAASIRSDINAAYEAVSDPNSYVPSAIPSGFILGHSSNRALEE